ncbi:MAG: hypothetical protein K1W34_20685 [Lachnospiraceae bacterium]
MILKANWKDGNFRGEKIPRGSLVSSIYKLSEETSLTEREVRTAISHLKTTGEVTSRSTNKFTVFSIKNYEVYQSNDMQTGIRETGRRHSNDILTTTIEERKQERRKEKEIVCTEPDKLDTVPPVISLILNDKTFYGVCQKDVEEWKCLYPSVDVIQELRKMKGWCDSNPSRRKTRRGIKRFINTWLAKEQDKGGGSVGCTGKVNTADIRDAYAEQFEEMLNGG